MHEAVVEKFVPLRQLLILVSSIISWVYQLLMMGFFVCFDFTLNKKKVIQK